MDRWPRWYLRGRRLARECEDFLAGRYLGCADGRPTQAWMWLNSLAHCRLGQLHHMAEDGVRRASDFASDWVEARRTVAIRLRALVDGDAALLRRVQRDVLVPLELDLVGRADVTPLTLIDVALCALESGATSTGDAQPC